MTNYSLKQSWLRILALTCVTRPQPNQISSQIKFISVHLLDNTDCCTTNKSMYRSTAVILIGQAYWHKNCERHDIQNKQKKMWLFCTVTGCVNPQLSLWFPKSVQQHVGHVQNNKTLTRYTFLKCTTTNTIILQLIINCWFDWFQYSRKTSTCIVDWARRVQTIGPLYVLYGPRYVFEQSSIGFPNLISMCTIMGIDIFFCDIQFLINMITPYSWKSTCYDSDRYKFLRTLRSLSLVF